MCIGEPLARTEGVLILAELMRRYEFSSVSGKRVQPTARVTLRPAQPVILKAKLRERSRELTATSRLIEQLRSCSAPTPDVSVSGLWRLLPRSHRHYAT